MRANTFSALSAKGWMMVSRSWYSRKRCVASALCWSQKFETAALSSLACIWPKALMIIFLSWCQNLRSSTPLCSASWDKGTITPQQDLLQAGTTACLSNGRWERSE